MTDAAATAAGPSTRSRLRLGSCPDSWGVWFADDPSQTPWPRFLDELAQAGYRWLELGPYGYLPTDPARLRDEVDRRGLRVSGQAVFGSLRDAHQVAELVTAMGADHVVLLPGDAGPNPADLDGERWRTLVERTSELGRILKEEHGVAAVFHPHADSYVGTQPQIERFLTDTDPASVNLCLDTGHGGGSRLRGGGPARRHVRAAQGRARLRGAAGRRRPAPGRRAVRDRRAGPVPLRPGRPAADRHPDLQIPAAARR